MNTEYPDHIERELRKARRAVAHLDGNAKAQLRAAIDYSVQQLEPDLTNLENALGVKIDRAAFALGIQCAGFAFDNTNVMAVVKTPVGRAMLLEIMAKARAR